MEAKRIKNQILSAIFVNFLSLGVGASMVWTSPYFAYLKSQDSHLKFPITVEEASTLGGLMPIGALIGAILYGWIAEKVGRFWALYLNAVPQIMWWLIAYFASDLNILYIGRVLSGLATGGTFTIVPLYVSEICQDHVRGSLSSFFILSLNLGMLLIYVVGEFLDYFTVQILFLSLPIIFMITFAYFPDTPINLLRKGEKLKAEKSLKFLRGYKKDEVIDISLDYEINILKMKIDENSKNSNGVQLSPVAIKALIFGMILVSFHQFSGLLVFVGYAGDIFYESGSSLTPNRSAIIVGIFLVFGSFISIVVMDKFPRKLLYLITNIGNIFGLLLMGFYGIFKIYFDVESFDYLKTIPIIALSLVILSASAGRLPLTYIITAEIQSQNSRSLGISVGSAVSWFVGFVMLKYFSSMMIIFGFYNCMFAFSLVLILSQFFVSIFIPETKSKSFDEIEDALRD